MHPTQKLMVLTPEEVRVVEAFRARRQLARSLALTPLPAPSIPEIMGRFRALIGAAAMEHDAGKWRDRAAQWPEKVATLLANLECRVADGQPVRNVAAYAETMWRKYCVDAPRHCA